MMKVLILDRCEFCDGKAYIFVCEDVDTNGQAFDRYRPCEMCYGSGSLGKWVSLEDFQNELADIQCRHENSSYRGGVHFSAGDVWDDVEEVCHTCNKVLG